LKAEAGIDMSKPDYMQLVAQAEAAVAKVKDPELKRVAFQRVLDDLLGARSAAKSAQDTERGAARMAKAAAGSVSKAEKRRPLNKSVQDAEASEPNLSQIVNLAKNCDESESIGRYILDKTSQLDRTLLPLYIIHENLDNEFGLTSGEIAKITKGLSVPVHISNVSKTLTGLAARYVVSDTLPKKGQAVRYKLPRRGLQYLQSVLTPKADADKA
jgi:hypothetical protein